MSKTSKAGFASPPPPPPRRLNPRALILLALALVLGVGGLVALGYVQSRRSMATYLDSARKALDKKQVDVALTYVNTYLQGHPDNIDALELKGKILHDIARDLPTIQEAIRVQTLLLSKDGTRLDARKRLIELDLKIHLFRPAQEAAEKYVAAIDPPDGHGTASPEEKAEAHRLMAQALEGVGYFYGDAKALDQAVVEFEKAEAIKPGDIGGASRLAEIYMVRGREPERAVGVLDKMLESNPTSVAARLARFRFFVRRPELGSKSVEAAKAEAVRPGLSKDGLAAYELSEALKLAPGDADARMFAAEDAAQRGDTTAARAHLAAISPPPKDELRLNLIKGLIEFKEQRPDEAIQSWRAGLIQTGGTDAQLHWRLARVLILMNRMREARQHMDQYLRLSGKPEPPPEYRYLEALVDLKAGRVKEAVAALESTRDKLKPGSPLPVSQQLVALGDAYAASRDESKAIDSYQQAANAPGAGAQPWQALARLHQAAGRPAESILALEKGLATNPNDPALLVALTQSLRQREMDKPRDRRDWVEFNDRLAQAERVAGDSPEVALLRADALADSGDLPAALARIEAAVKKAPTAVAPWLARVVALQKLGRVDEALNVVQEAIKAAGDNAQFRGAWATLLLRRGDTHAAYDVLAGGLDRVAADQRPLLWRAIGEYHMTQSDFAAARRAYEEWAKLQPEAAEPRVALMNVAVAMKDVPALQAHSEALRKVVGPDNVLGKVAHAEVLLGLAAGGTPEENKPRLDEVAKLAEEIKQAAPRIPAGHLIEAKLMERLGKVDEEIAAYRAALELRGGQAALRPLVSLLVRNNRAAELEELHKKLPNFPPEVDQMAIQLLIQRGDAVAAEQLVDQMVQGNPQALDVAIWKVKVLNSLGKPDEAEEFLRAQTRQRPDSAGAWMQLLMFQASRNERDKAQATLAQMRQRLRPERPELLWAACYRSLEMRAEADAEFAKALQKWGEDPGVLQVVVDYFESTGRPEQAEPLLRALLKARPGFDWARRRLALALSARPGDAAAMSEAIALVGAPSPGESPDDRKLRAIVFSRSEDPARQAEAIAILEALAAEVPEPERSQLHETMARSLAGSAEKSRAAGDEARAAADRDRALKHAEAAAARPEARAEVILFHAALQLLVGDVDGARKGLARLEKSDPKALATVELKARIAHADKKDDEAERLIFAAFDERKSGREAMTAGVGLIRLLRAIGREDAAERIAAQLAESGPQGRIALARLLADHGKAQKAAEELERVVKEGGSAAADAARATTAIANEVGGDWVGRADGLLTLALKAQPDSLDLLLARAFLEHLHGDFKAEVATYEGILAKNPANYTFLNNLAWTLSEELNRPQDGLARIDEGIKRVGRQAHLVDTRGVILLRLGRTDEAIKELEEAAGGLGSGPIYYHLARAYKKANRDADAAKALDRARKAGLKPEKLQPSERAEAAGLLGPTPEPAKAASGGAAPAPGPGVTEAAAK